MALNIVGKGKQLNELSSSFDKATQNPNTKPSLQTDNKEKLEKSIKKIRMEPTPFANTTTSGRPIRKFTTEDLSPIRNSPLRRPDKTSEASFSVQKAYLSSSPTNQTSSDTQSKIEGRLRDYAKSRMSEIRIKSLYKKKVSEWTVSKRIRKEELIRKMDWMKRPSEISPGAREIYYDEDFHYSFVTREGKARRKYEKLIDVSSRPNYLAPSKYISIQPHVVYNSPKVVERKFSYLEQFGESFRVKSALAAKNIALVSHEVHPYVIELTPTELPKGGETLLKC